MPERRNHDEPGRRKEDRWVTQAIAQMEIRLGKTEDHVDDVDDYLRGAATGKMSLDTRIELMEAELHALGVLTRRMSDQFGELMGTSTERLEEIKKATETQFREIQTVISALQIHKAIMEGAEAKAEKREATRLERFKEWMKLWGALGIAVIALIVPLATLLVQNWDHIWPRRVSVQEQVRRWTEEMDRARKDPDTRRRLKERYGVEP